MLERAYAVIMAGGRGERFWPLGTSRRPKQFLTLVGEEPLLVQSVRRLDGLIPPERLLIVTSEALVDETRRLAAGVPPGNVFGEPFGRDTAAAIATGAAMVRARDPRGVLAILTADQVIGDLPLFHSTLRESLRLAAERDVLLTIGIPPRSPSTAYGYIDAGDRIESRDGIAFHAVRRFVEKPDRPTAERYVAEGHFYWNSGMFIWSLDALDRALRRHAPALADLTARLAPEAAAAGPAFAAAVRAEYERLPKISIDYALMEKADNIVMARGPFAWDDVGSLPALANHFAPDADGNIVVG